ncbi:MAG: hypothetical protein HYY42_06330 [Chloroflexi bacterium]|nr:hypothetical protein [Chloroflexota bacterium]
MSRQLQVATLAAAALVLSGGGFVAGMTVGLELSGKAEPAAGAAQGTTAPRQQGAARPGAGAGATATGAGAGGQVVGRVLSVNDGSITLEVRQPGGDSARSVIALVGSSSRIVRSVETEIKLGDIKAGEQVVVLGQTDAATGTVAANAVVVGQNALQQIFGGGPGQGGARPTGSGAPRPSPSPRP